MYFAGAPLPASSAVQVSALVRPELLLEIEAFALVPEKRPERTRERAPELDALGDAGAGLRLLR